MHHWTPEELLSPTLNNLNKLDIDMCTAAAVSATLPPPPTVRAQLAATADIYVDRRSGMTL